MAKSARRDGLETSVHLTETCEQDAPHLITHVTTTAAATTDEALTETIHADLEHMGLTVILGIFCTCSYPYRGSALTPEAA